MALLIGIWHDWSFTLSRQAYIDSPQDACDFLCREFSREKNPPDEILHIRYSHGSPQVEDSWHVNQDYSILDN